MSKKLWYSIELECIKLKDNSSMLVGEKETICKVKSKGLAFVVAADLEKMYNKEYFNIIIK